MTALIYAAIGSSYMFEFGNAAKDGASSPFCAKYLADVDGCSEHDVPFLLMKYHSSVLLAFVVGGTVLVCWNDAPVLQRLNMHMSVAPVGAILVAIVVDAVRGRLSLGGDDSAASTTSLLRPALALHVLSVGGGVLTLAVNSALTTGVARTTRPLPITTQTVACGALAGLVSWAASAALLRGVSTEDRATASVATASSILVAIDRFALTLLALFPALYASSSSRRRIMIVLASTIHYYLRYQYPSEKEYLHDAERVWEVLAVMSAVVGAAAILPEKGTDPMKHPLVLSPEEQKEFLAD